jgi:hypothetical protein
MRPPGGRLAVWLSFKKETGQPELSTFREGLKERNGEMTRKQGTAKPGTLKVEIRSSAGKPSL